MTVVSYEEARGLDIPEAATGTVDIARVRALTLRYLVVSTILLGAGGLLGILLRQSQADLDRISPNLWYEVMTAHGLATFVGWAAFALMGVTWWVLAECGFPIQGWGWRFAVACFWTMTIGATGVVVTTLGMGFAGSWVFLYPLPFHGTWSMRATGIFSLSILSVGLSIFAYCFGILAVVLGDGLGAKSRSWGNRLGCALGFGYIWPKRFATDRPVPFPVLPLTVIAIDMIIATVPLAVLLVEMVVQSFFSGVTVDPVLAKSMLWWFGHPVVYLLLFPAVAVYYHLIPRYAKRPLVAGHIIGVGWLIGVCANVVIGAHHMYLDFPNTFQQTVLHVRERPDLRHHAHDALQSTPASSPAVADRGNPPARSRRCCSALRANSSDLPLSSLASAVSISERMSPMPRMRPTMRSGWKGSSPSYFSPMPMNLIGCPVTLRIESAAPPRASPSILVRTTPVSVSFLWNSSAERTASWPVIESATKRISCGFRIFFSDCISSINCSSMCRRPAVSTMSTSQALLMASRRASFTSRSTVAVLTSSTLPS